MIEGKGSFLNPPKDARPLVRWWWPGVDVKKSKLREEIAQMDEKGFWGAEIHITTLGLPPNMKRKDAERYNRCHSFMRPYYYEILSAVLDEAKNRKMTIDLSICSGWPPGGTHVKEEDFPQALYMGQKTLKGNKRYRGSIPPPRISPARKPVSFLKRSGPEDSSYPHETEMRHLIAVRHPVKQGLLLNFYYETNNLPAERIKDLTGRVDEKGVLEWDVPEGKWELFAFYSGMIRLKPSFSAKEDPEKEDIVFDHLSYKPVLRNIRNHIGSGTVYFGDHFGRTLRGFFADKPGQISPLSWTDDFIREFRERRGYDLTPFMPALFYSFKNKKNYRMPAGNETSGNDTEEDALAERIKYDYELTVSDLFIDNFVKGMTEWGTKNRLKSRIQVHGLKVDTLKAYGLAGMPETEQDYAGGINHFLKLAGSAGIIYDKPVVAGAAMVWNGRDYKTTPEKWKIAADKFFTAGINQLIYHGFPYEDPYAECPESYQYSGPHVPEHLYSSANFSPINEFWEYLPRINIYVTRCQFILQQADTVCNVGVYYPAFGYCDAVLKPEEITAGYLGEDDAPPEKFTKGSKIKTNLNEKEDWLKSQVELGDHLAANGYYYTHVNEERLLNGRVEGGKLILGTAELEAIIFNRISFISPELAGKLKQMAEAGVRIIFTGSLPDRQPGYYNYEVKDRKIKELIRDINEKEKAYIAGDNPVPFLKVKGVLPDVVFEREEQGIHFIHKRAGGTDYYFIRSSYGNSRRITISFPYGYRTPFILDPWSGDVSEAPLYEADGDYIKMELDFAPYGSKLIEFRNVDAEKKYILSGDISVFREEKRLTAYTDSQGEFNFKLKTGEWIKETVSNPVPDPLELNRWKLETECSDHDGEEKKVMSLVGLKDWRLIPELKYYSGRGVYLTEFNLEKSWLRNHIKLFLSLGKVGDVAIVSCNEAELKPLLMTPYEVDITPYVRSGGNELKVTVITTLNNRLIGYGRRRKPGYRNHKNKKNLMPSGLIGPVRIIPVFKIVII